MATIDEMRENQIEQILDSINLTRDTMQTQRFLTNGSQNESATAFNKVDEEQSYIDTPPPYSYENSIPQNEMNSLLPIGQTYNQKEQIAKLFSNQPPLFMELVMGHKLSKKVNKRRQRKRLERLEEVHDAWFRLGLDTRAILRGESQQTLPPFFWNPPKYDAAEMNRRLALLI